MLLCFSPSLLHPISLLLYCPPLPFLSHSPQPVKADPHLPRAGVCPRLTLLRCACSCWVCWVSLALMSKLIDNKRFLFLYVKLHEIFVVKSCYTNKIEIRVTVFKGKTHLKFQIWKQQWDNPRFPASSLLITKRGSLRHSCICGMAQLIIILTGRRTQR